MAKKIVVTSGKGGVGKTTVTANLGVQLARRGRRVIVCDLDFGLNNVDVALGVENCATYDVIDVVEGRCRAKQALVRHPKFPTLFLLSSNRLTDRYVSPQAIRLVLDSLAPQFDYILIDSPAGIDDGFHRAVASADEALVVTAPHISAVRDADRVIGMLKSYRLSRVSLVVNLVRGDLVKKGDVLPPTQISDLLKVPLVGVIGEEDRVLIHNIWEKSRAFRGLAVFYETGKSDFLPQKKRGLFRR